jgi:hypothetical protein
MLQNEENGIEEIIKEDIWGSIEEFLGWGFHYGEGENSIHITVGTNGCNDDDRIYAKVAAQVFH